MPVSWIHSGAGLSAPRGTAVVCILVNARELVACCLRSVRAHTPRDVPILICDNPGPESRSLEFMTTLERESDSAYELFYLRRDGQVGSAPSADNVFALAAPADVVLLSSDSVVANGWLESLRRAAYVDSTVATSTPLTTDHSALSGFGSEDRGRPQAEWRFDDAAAAVRSHSLRLRPRLPAAAGHCIYVRRSALELVGGFDPGSVLGGSDEACFSRRCVRSGLSHVLADDVLVLHRGRRAGPGNSQWPAVTAERARVVAGRYPHDHNSGRSPQGEPGPLMRSMSSARRALTGLSVVIDARILSRPKTGTETQVLELIAALARTQKAHLTAIVPDTLADYAAKHLASLPSVSLVHHSEAVASTRGSADVVHRPYQINDPGDLTFLASLGERLIVTNQDLISYHNPSYFKDFEAWDGYRRLTRLTLAAVDRVVFFSAHARDAALAEDLVEPSRASVVALGVDHALAQLDESPAPPAGALTLPQNSEAMLCIGNDFRHKNRIFALRMVEQLQRRHDWTGYLLFAGPTVPDGSSRSEEARLLAQNSRLAEVVIDCGAVSEAEKSWLFGRVGLVLYPTLYEGFGLVPFEAAQHGVPCLWAAGTSLGEVLPEKAAEIEAWDAEQGADRAIDLLRDESTRQCNLAAIRAAGAELTWDATAARLLELYDLACDAPATPASARQRHHGLSQVELGEDAMRLVGPGGALPPDVERPLLALATHPQFGATVFGALKLGYRASHKVRRRVGRTLGDRPS